MKIEDGLGTAEVGGGGNLVIVASGTVSGRRYVERYLFTVSLTVWMHLGRYTRCGINARGTVDLHPSGLMVCLAMYPNLVD